MRKRLDLKKDVRIIVRAYRFMQPYGLAFFIGVFLFIGMGVVGSLNDGLMMRSLTAASLAGDMSIFYRGLWLYILLTVSQYAALALQMVLYNYPKICMEVDMKIKLIEKTIRMKMERINRTHTGELLSRFNNDAKAAVDVVGNGMVHMASSFVGGVAMVITIALLCWPIALYAFVIGVINIWISTKLAPVQRKVSEGYQIALGKITSRIMEILSGAQVIRLFGLQQTMMKRLGFAVDDGANKMFSRQMMDSMSYLVVGMINMLGVAGTFVLGTWLYRAHMVTLPNVLGSLMMAGSVGWSFTNAAFLLVQYQKSLAAAELLLGSLDSEDEETSFGGKMVDRSASPVIQISNLTCTYTDRAPALQDVNITVRKHQFVGLVGLSGGGKSTLIKALMQFVDYEGEMLLFGSPAHDYSLDSLRHSMAYVAQESVLFDDTVGVNIGYGRPGATEQEIEWAAKMAYAYDFIMDMPEKFNTRVGERGVQLSGGQRQRVAIARAFLMDAPILLLDEATSALDSQSEAQVQAALEQLMKGRTIVSVAHRLCTIQGADEILVFDQGTIVERGTHQQLLDSHGYYAGLYQAQTASSVIT